MQQNREKNALILWNKKFPPFFNNPQKPPPNGVYIKYYKTFFTKITVFFCIFRSFAGYFFIFDFKNALKRYILYIGNLYINKKLFI